MDTYTAYLPINSGIIVARNVGLSYMLPLPTGSRAKPHVVLSASQRAWLLGCGVTFTHSPSPTHFRGLAFWTRSINMMQKIGSCVGCLQVKVSHSRASSPWAAWQSVSWIHVCVHLYVGVVRIGLMKIMRDAIMRMQKQRRHVYAVYCCIGAWAASGDQVFYGTSVREQLG
jgi:hypothetical protein